MNIDTRSSLVKRMAWDTLPCTEVREMLPLLGLTPASEDVEQAEHEASHARLDVLMPIQHAVLYLAGIEGEVMARAMLYTHGEATSGEVADAAVESATNLIAAGCLAVMSSLFDMGLIEYGTGMVVVGE